MESQNKVIRHESILFKWMGHGIETVGDSSLGIRDEFLDMKLVQLSCHDTKKIMMWFLIC